MTLQEKAQKYINQFDTITIQDTNKTRVILKDDASEELKLSVQNAHQDKLPRDFVYETYLRILEKICDYNTDSMDFFDETRYEIVDSMVDIYTSDLVEWLGEDNNNVYYLSDAISDGVEDGFQALQLAQYKAIDEIFPYVQELLS